MKSVGGPHAGGGLDSTALDYGSYPLVALRSNPGERAYTNLSVYTWRSHGDDKTLKRRFQTSFYPENPWIEYSIKYLQLFVSVVSFLSWGKRSSPFFYLVLRD